MMTRKIWTTITTTWTCMMTTRVRTMLMTTEMPYILKMSNDIGTETFTPAF